MASQAAVAETNAVGRAKPQQKPPSMLKRLMGALLFSLFFSILLEWLGITFFWPELGGLHSEQVLRSELEFLHEDFRQGLFDSSPSLVIRNSASTVYYYLFELSMIADAVIWAGEITGLGDYAQAAINTVQIFMIRLGILIFSLPIFILFALVGASSGLSMRDIRRWSGGREYGRVYHKAKAMAPKALIVAWIIYLSLPEAIHPNLIILPCAVLFGLNVLIVTASFKKYL